MFEGEGGLERGDRFDCGVALFNREEAVSSSRAARLCSRCLLDGDVFELLCFL